MEKNASIENMKFERLFSWGPPTNEETAEIYTVNSKNTHSRRKKHP